MYMLTAALTGCLLAGTTTAQRADGQFWPCNPIKNATGACPPDPGLPTSTYSIDFTKQTSIPANWTISNYASIPFGPNGAEFTFAKRYDAPQLWADFFILFGKVTLTARIANGTGMISSFVLMSDDFDEIDFEFSGNNFGDKASHGKGQNNYFGKGITGNYDRGGWFDLNDPQGSWHEYGVEWTEEKIVWSVDGRIVRTFLARDGTTGKGSAYQFPQTPSKFQLGIWAGGDPGMNEGTKSWAGGETNISAAPYTMYVKNVKIENYKPAWAYNWTDQSGTWQSIQLLQGPDGDGDNETIVPPTSSSSRAPSSSSSTVKPSSSVTTSRIVSSSTTIRPSSSSSTTRPVSSTSEPDPVPSSSKPTSSSTPQSTSIRSSTITKPSSTTVRSTSTVSTSKKPTTITSTSEITSTPKITTTKYTTTTTSCKPTSTPKITATTASQQWQWGGWGSWWRNGENVDNDGNWNWVQRQRGRW